MHVDAVALNDSAGPLAVVGRDLLLVELDVENLGIRFRPEGDLTPQQDDAPPLFGRDRS
jgi:hypothetical protein